MAQALRQVDIYFRSRHSTSLHPRRNLIKLEITSGVASVTCSTHSKYINNKYVTEKQGRKKEGKKEGREERMKE